MIRSRLLFLVLPLALMLMCGCSGDSEHGRKAESSPEKKVEAVEKPKREPCFLAFGGGPTGGTFNFFANKMSSIITSSPGGLDVSPKGSGGSGENLRSLNKGAVELGIVYSGDAFLGREGKLPKDTRKYDKVRALSFLYGAPAQLIVRRDSEIRTVADLEGRTVATGNPGSGAALAAERFFRHLGLWDKIKHRNLGYTQAASEFADGRIDAFWVLVGYPNSAVIEAASRTHIRLLDLNVDAQRSGFFKSFPFYMPATIPAHVYEGQTQPVGTFQDASLWCANAGVAADVVHECLSDIFSEKGLREMAGAHKAASALSVQRGIDGVSIPLHPGAVKFWQEKGLSIPSNLR